MKRWLAMALLAPTISFAAATTPLEVGQSVSLQLTGNAFSNALVVNVPAGIGKLRLRALAANSAQDIDLLTRFDRPFPDLTLEGSPPEASFLFEHADYLSASASGEEEILLSRSGHQPLRAGQLHLSLINFSAQPAQLTVSVEALDEGFFYPITPVFTDSSFDCDLSGWNDATARTPVRGNNGTTLGEQRRNALNEAARLLSEELKPNAPIKIQACWDSLDFGAQGGVLAQAAPYYVIARDAGNGANLPFVEQRFTAQAAAAISHQAGTAFCRYGGGDCAQGTAELFAQFNLAVDQSTNERQRFDYGFTAGDAGSGSSFVTTAMHEIAHGLGFLGRIDLISTSANFGQQRITQGLRYDDAYGRHARYVAGNPIADRALLDLDVTTRIQALTSGSFIYHTGPQTLASSENANRNSLPPFNYVPLHAPAEVAPGSTYSHLNSSTSFPTPQLMTAAISQFAPRSLGIARGVLADAGWSNEPKTVPALSSPLQSQYFDVARNGHGFEIRKVAGVTAANGEDLYFVTFYSFDANRQPEFFNAVGPILNGVFNPSRDPASGDSLSRPLYLGRDASPQTTADPAADFDGQVRIDFVNAARHPVCRDGAAGRQLDGSLAVMSWTLQGQEAQWCVQALSENRDGIATDFSNQWFDPADTGWGLSVFSFPGNGQDGLALELYFPDASGRGRWGLVYTDAYVPGQPLTVQGPQGFCRDCPLSELQFSTIGEMRIDLRTPEQGPSTVSFDVTYPGAEGGRFTRSNAVIVPVGTPNY